MYKVKRHRLVLQGLRLSACMGLLIGSAAQLFHDVFLARHSGAILYRRFAGLVVVGTVLVLYEAVGSRVAEADSLLVREPVTVDALISHSGTPLITGTRRADRAGGLTVTVNRRAYRSGDGYLMEYPGGNWSLQIPPFASLPDGVYEVLAIVLDLSGGLASDLTREELVIDTTPPAVVPRITVPTTSESAELR